jgi:homoserine O-succinyltransferase
MALTLEYRSRPQAAIEIAEPEQPGDQRALRIGLINNMPDAALQSTEAQFGTLLGSAAGTTPIILRPSSFPELPRGPQARARTAADYWPLEELLRAGLDAMIVTGTEPRAAQLRDEPYWDRFRQLLDWAQEHRMPSIWSCLAAHAAVEVLDGIKRQRLPEKRCGIYEHATLSGHALLRGAGSPLHMPHSRWNDLPLEDLRNAGYTLLSWSNASGADSFARQRDSLLLFFQGHPEYEATTLLKEYRRDVGRFLAHQQEHYPTLPLNYLPADAARRLEVFRDQAIAQRDPALLEHFPFSAVAGQLHHAWQGAAIALYRNWLAVVKESAAPRTREPVSLA